MNKPLLISIGINIVLLFIIFRFYNTSNNVNYNTQVDSLTKIRNIKLNKVDSLKLKKDSIIRIEINVHNKSKRVLSDIINKYNEDSVIINSASISYSDSLYSANIRYYQENIGKFSPSRFSKP